MRTAHNKLTQKEIIAKFITVHGDRYNYSLVKYTTSKEKVIIICRKHGEFTQTSDGHGAGRGCLKCSYEEKGQALSDRTKKTILDDFISVHGNKYDYSKVVYTRNQDKVEIICNNCETSFKQTPGTHRGGSGCPHCSHKLAMVKRRNTTQDIIERFKAVHEDKYDYSKVRYTSLKNDVEIICREHGSFMQSPINHIKGSGCKACSKYGFDSSKEAIFYYLRVENHGEVAYKIGITNRTIEDRYRKDVQFITVLLELPFELGALANKYETLLKRRYNTDKWTGINLLQDGNTELFSKDILNLDTKEPR